MSRSFNGATPDFIEYTTPLATAVPLSIAAWIYPGDNTTSQDVACVARQASTNGFRLNVGGATVGDPMRAITQSGGSTAIAATTTGITLNTWYHACAVFAGNADRRVYLNGGSKGTEATSLTPAAAPDRTTIGRLTSGTSPYTGRIAEVAFWSAALSDAEVAALALGVSPRLIQPAALLGYPPIWGLSSPEIDLVKNSAVWTLSGAPALANHAPVSPFAQSLWTPNVDLEVSLATGGSHRGALLGVGA